VRRSRVWLIAVALLALVAGGASADAAISAPRTSPSVTLATHYDGQLRNFRMYVAPHVPDRLPVPLLLVLHGLHLDPQTAEATTGFDAVAGREDVALLFPDGVDKSWNAGTCCGPSSKAGVDDVGLLAHVVQLASAVRPIDRQRVFVAGFSNGGMMALRAVCERPDVFTAAVSVAGTLATQCGSGAPISALLLNGTSDKTVPFGGTGYSSFLQTSLTAVPRAVASLAARAGCAAAVTQLEEDYRRTTYRRCAAGGAVELVAVDGLGHGWPTTARGGIDAGGLAWDFFSRRSNG